MLPLRFGGQQMWTAALCLSMLCLKQFNVSSVDQLILSIKHNLIKEIKSCSGTVLLDSTCVLGFCPNLQKFHKSIQICYVKSAFSDKGLIWAKLLARAAAAVAAPVKHDIKQHKPVTSRMNGDVCTADVSCA